MEMIEFIEKANEYGGKKLPFFFIVDFEMLKPRIFVLEDTAAKGIFYDFGGITNYTEFEGNNSPFYFSKTPVAQNIYERAFENVMRNLNYGNTYLINLTFPSKIETNLSLKDIFLRSQAKYKIYIENEFVCFSPEIFIKIQGDLIYSYPMKGTISDDLPDALNVIMSDAKEEAEHNTIVDLIRNDISVVASEVVVTKFRYPDYLRTNNKGLIQISSEIRGKLSNHWHNSVGNILDSLLPAGSVSGAPKIKTLEVIRDAEAAPRAYYTGVAGIFDGENLNSCVLIRFIEQRSDGLYFRSGGGITAMSDMDSEYKELIDKIYVPIY